MIVWLDSQLPPALADWLSQTFPITAHSVRTLGLPDATDQAIFARAREAGVVVLTQDGAFVELVERHGPPPRIVWLTVGSTSRGALQELLLLTWPRAQELLETGEPLVEISLRD